MILHRDSAGRMGGAGTGGMPTSPYELARSLRRVRTRQGLRLEDVSARTGLPLHQLQAIETGAFDAVADRVAALRTLRRYADFLGLPGDRYVLVLVEHWPPPPTPPPQIVALHTGPPATGMVPEQGSAFDPPTGQLAGPGSLGPTTSVLPAVGPSGSPTSVVAGAAVTGMIPAGPPGGQLPGAGLHDTGITAAVPATRPGMSHPRPAARTPLALRLLVALVTLAVVVGVAGLLIHRYEPRWLSSLGITAKSGTTGKSGTTAKSGTTGKSGTKGAGSGGSSKGRAKGGGPATMTVNKTSPNTATFLVKAPSFTVKVAVASSDSWVQATGQATGQATVPATGAGAGAPTSSSVLFSGVLTGGQSKVFTVQNALTVQIGSIAAQVYVSVGSTPVGSYDSTVAPFTMTFQTVTS
ncbi:MAG: helix-turn-helix domain-containing protein [Acidimicrobiales bacterium]